MEKIISQILVGAIFAAGLNALADDPISTNLSVAPKVPAFSVNYMDRSVNPATNFYQFANGE